MSNPDDPVFTIAVFSADLGGFYLGELVNQARQLCLLKRYRFIGFRTPTPTAFESPFQLNAIDGVIVIRNALSVTQVEFYQAQGIPVVSVGYDYFPLDVPVVLSNNEQGSILAYNHLKDKGHSDIAFIGDISHYDMRMRYEAYCTLVDADGEEFSERNFFLVTDALPSGGIKAADKFVEIGCTATAVICGSGLTAIGFENRLKKHGISNIEIVTFDTISTIPVVAPTITCIDQNLHLLAYTAINALEKKLKNEECKREFEVQPRLVDAASNAEMGADAYIATCVECETLYNPNYSKSLIANIFEWPNEIAESNLDTLMSISHLFERFMGVAILSRFFYDKSGEEYCKLMKIFSPSKTLNVALDDKTSICRSLNFPPSIMAPYNLNQFDMITHLVLLQDSKPWGALSFYGDSTKPNLSSYLGFSGYVQSAAEQYMLNRELNQYRKDKSDKGHSDRAAPVQNSAIASARVDWDIRSGNTHWSTEALIMLGLDSDIEQNIYRNMNISDRMTPLSGEEFRSEFSDHMRNGTSFDLIARYKFRKIHEVEIGLHCHPTFDSSNIADKVEFYLTQLDD